MRLKRGVSMLAAAASAGAIMGPAVPAAGAHAISSGTGGGSGSGPVAVSSQQPTGSSTEWGLIGVSAAGGAALTAAGMTAARRRGRATAARSTATQA
jgi:hypothetical protein